MAYLLYEEKKYYAALKTKSLKTINLKKKKTKYLMPYLNKDIKH